MLVPALLIAIPVHEMGHAAAAYFQGDRSVRYFGYFTLNPRRFLEPIGVIAVFVALVGWGRKVTVQPDRISTTRQRLVHALGGPAANLLVAIALGLVLRGLHAIGIHESLTASTGLLAFPVYFIGQFIGIPVLSIVMTPFYQPASLISVGQCIGYGVPRFNALYPCLLSAGSSTSRTPRRWSGS